MKPLRRKPSQQRSRETVDVVFEAAMRELQRGDPTAVNVNRVAETAGVSIGSIYQYFPSKETLLSSLIAHYMRRRFEAIMAMIRALQDEERTTGTLVSRRGYRLAPLVWGVGLTLGVATAYARIAADRHYFTDVLAGAAIGTVVGGGIPLLFHAEVPRNAGAASARLTRVAVVPSSRGAMIGFGGTF